MKHLEIREKQSSARRIFNPFLGVSSGDETLCLMFDILHQTQAVNAILNLPIIVKGLNLGVISLVGGT